MKLVNIVLCAVMFGFAALQYNDPDAPLWFAIYAVSALWSGIAAFRLAALLDTRVLAGLGACLLAALIGTAYYWPQTPGWWRIEVWWEVETAREGMGMMAVTLALLVALANALAARGRLPGNNG